MPLLQSHSTKSLFYTEHYCETFNLNCNYNFQASRFARYSYVHMKFSTLYCLRYFFTSKILQRGLVLHGLSVACVAVESVLSQTPSLYRLFMLSATLYDVNFLITEDLSNAFLFFLFLALASLDAPLTTTFLGVYYFISSSIPFTGRYTLEQSVSRNLFLHRCLYVTCFKRDTSELDESGATVVRAREQLTCLCCSEW